MARSTAQYRKTPPDDTPVIQVLEQLTQKHPAIGVWHSHHRMRLMGHLWNIKRVCRVCTGLGLNIRRRAKKRLPARVKQALFRPAGPDQLSMRRELLSACVFRTLDELPEKADEWMNDYNHHRPHKSFGYRPPALIRS